LNTIRLPHIKGVGLFPGIVMADHSCKANCVVETFGTKAVLTTLYPIPKDEKLTLNYLESSYLPRAARQELIRSLYNYSCVCSLCLPGQRDETRAFICKKCNYVSETDCGIIAPKGHGDNLQDWVCDKCGTGPTEDGLQEYRNLEKSVIKMDIVTLKVADLIRGKIFHPNHYLVYRALVERVNMLLSIKPSLCEKYIATIQSANSRVLVDYHPDRANFNDLLGQARKIIGDVKGCKEAYVTAFNMRDKFSCKTSPNLALAKQKSEQNPDKVEINYWIAVGQ
jgi:hypothetical protein